MLAVRKPPAHHRREPTPVTVDKFRLRPNLRAANSDRIARTVMWLLEHADLPHDDMWPDEVLGVIEWSRNRLRRGT